MNNDNYQLWKFKVHILLCKDDFWDVLSSDRAVDYPAEWDKKNRKAKACKWRIHMIKEDTATGYVECTPKTAWKFRPKQQFKPFV